MPTLFLYLHRVIYALIAWAPQKEEDVRRERYRFIIVKRIDGEQYVLIAGPEEKAKLSVTFFNSGVGCCLH